MFRFRPAGLPALVTSLVMLGDIARAEPLEPVPAGDPSIEIEARTMKAHMAVLADDLLEGREAGTRGEALTALYLRTRFEALGLEPAGEDDTFLQSFKIRTAILNKDSVDFRIKGPSGEQRFALGEDMAVYGNFLEADQQVEGDVVFVGYGMVAPEFGIDDYAGLDVEGKVVAMFSGVAPFLPAAEGAHYGSADHRHRLAQEKGAIGIIDVWTDVQEQRFAFDLFKTLLGRANVRWGGQDGIPQLTAPEIRLRAFVRRSASEALFEGAPRSLESVLEEAKTGAPKGFPLKTRARLSRRTLHNDKLSAVNVAGLLPGRDPELKKEFVVLTAHHDHVGVGVPVEGDDIYNGALDNAIGTSALLAVAKALTEADEAPRRSVLFLAVGAEEKGLIGSDYWTAHPTVPLDKVIANINLDGAMPFYDFRDIIAFGAEQSQMGERLATAGATLGLTVAPDPFPEQGIFTRSDQYSFVKKGIPALFLYMGFTDLEGQNVGRPWWDKTYVEVYHLPGDDLSLPHDYAIAAKYAEMFRRVTLTVTETTEKPRWYGDSLFGARFAPQAEKAERPAE